MGGMNDKTSPFDPQQLWQRLQTHLPVSRWLVGFSGGLDSTVLLSALLSTRPAQPIIAIHVNHSLSENAEEWQSHCEALCQQWGVHLEVERVKVQPAGFGIEDAAREARYAAFARHMQAGDCLLLGHHRDDQAETLLLRLMRGAGPRGLGGIVRERFFAGGKLVRPLLDFERAELEHFACQSDLSWIIDESNLDERFDRNFVRRRVLPVLSERWPDFGRRWQLTAEACQEADQLCRDLAEQDLLDLDENTARGGWSLDRNRLAKLPAYRRNNVLRGWVLARRFPVMERRHLDEIERQFFTDEPASGAMVKWSGTALGYFRDRLYLISAPLEMPESTLQVDWNLSSNELPLPDGSILQAIPSARGLRMSGAKIEVKWRRGGERCRPSGRAHSQTVKKLLQEYGLEPWWRQRIPLIYLDGELAAVGDLWICHPCVTEEETSVALRWLPEGKGAGWAPAF